MQTQIVGIDGTACCHFLLVFAHHNGVTTLTGVATHFQDEVGFLVGIVIIGRGDAAAFDTVALDPRETWRAVVVVGSIPTIPIDIAHIERMGSVGTDGDVDDVTVKGAQIIPVFGIAVVVIEEAQRRIDGLPLLQLQTAIELVVVDSFAPIGVRVEAIG